MGKFEVELWKAISSRYSNIKENELIKYLVKDCGRTYVYHNPLIKVKLIGSRTPI